MPNPPRTLVLWSSNGCQAKPNRGAKSVFLGKLAPVGAPGSPGNSRPAGALGNFVEWAPGTTEKVRPKVSDLGVLYSYRKPRVNTRRLVTCHSSCPKM